MYNQKIAEKLLESAVVADDDKKSLSLIELYREYTAEPKGLPPKTISLDEIAVIIGLARIAGKTVELLGEVIVKTLTWILRLYENVYNIEALRAECVAAGRLSPELRHEEIQKISNFLDHTDSLEKIGGMKALARFWKRVVKIFPGFCVALEGEREAKKLLAQARKDLVAFRKWEGYEATRTLFITTIIIWILFLKGKIDWPVRANLEAFKRVDTDNIYRSKKFVNIKNIGSILHNILQFVRLYKAFL